MSVTERILLSSGCCATPPEDNYPELGLALIVGILISAFVCGCFNFWHNRTRPTAVDASHDKNKVSPKEEAGTDDSDGEVTCVISTSLRWSDNKENEVSDEARRVYDAVMTYQRPRRASSHELHVLSPATPLNVGDLDSHCIWDHHHLVRYPFHLDDIRRLEYKSFDILQEFLVINDMFLHKQAHGWKVNTRDKGRVFHLMKRGRMVKENCDKCPETKRVIYRLTNVMDDCAFGFISFSVMEPGTSYPTHRGPTNIRIRCHLGLSVPEDNCYLTVNGERRWWEQGRCLLFEDCQPHQSANRGDRARAILIVDLWHPGLTDKEIEYLTRCFPSRD